MNGDVTVREVANREFVGVSESDNLLEVVDLLLAEGAEAAVVLRGSERVGVVTDRDVVSLLGARGGVEGATAADAMDRSVPTVDAGATVTEATDRMSAENTRRLVVVEDGQTVGVVTEHDLFAVGAARGGDPTAGPGPTAAHPGGAETAVAADAGPGGADVAGDAGGFEEQSICEACGRLVSDLVAFNGQLLCGDCRDR